MSARGPLAGYRALDLTDHRGALAGRLLADLGVDVVKVEPPGGEASRCVPPFAGDRPGPTRSLSWLPGNFGKRSIELDLDTDADRATVRRLAAASDFVLESFPPGHLAARGLGWEALARSHPSLALTSITAFGQTGPRAGWQPTDLTLMALGGIVMVCGERDRPPLRIGIPQAWYHAGAEAAVATLIAHHWRERSGQGQWIDLSQLEAGLQFLGPALLEEVVNGRPWGRRGNADLVACPHGTYPCAGTERWVALAVETGEAWRRLAGLIGRPAWGEDPTLATAEGRRAHARTIDAAVAAWTRERSPEEAAAELQRHGVPAGAVASCADLHADPQLRHAGFFVTVEHPVIGPLPIEGHAFRLPACPPAWRPAPLWGEHNEHVFGEILGLGAEEIERLRRDRVIW